MGTASMTIGQFRELAGAVSRSLPDDLDTTIAQWWIENQESLRRILRDALMMYGAQINAYPIFVDYGLSIYEAVRLGHYDRTDSNITSEHSPTRRKGKAEVVLELIHFDRVVSTDEALSELDKMGYRPAELHELLAFGEKYPGPQREFPIIALGSVWLWGYDHYVPFLYGSFSKRNLETRLIEGGWSPICRFAAVRK